MGAFTGHRVVLVGTFSLYQHEVKELIEAEGGVVSDFIDSATTLVVRGNTTGDSNAKLAYANRYRVPIKDEKWVEMQIRARMAGDEKRAEEELVKVNDHNYGTW